jgi:hypothetical protein
MRATKVSVGGFLALGLAAASLFAEGTPAPKTAPTKVLTYFDSASIPPGPRPDGAVYTFVDPADPAVAALAQYGFKAIDQIGGKMIAEVNRELATKETAQAVAILHLKDLQLPKPVAGQPTVTAIKRTSLMLRDPRNAPDGADAAALDKIHVQLMEDKSPDKMIVQKIEQPGHAVEWRVYRPIASTPACLACHGDPDKFRPGVKAALDQLYPQDKAVDYSAQEWRGVIRVSLAPAAPAAAK